MKTVPWAETQNGDCHAFCSGTKAWAWPFGGIECLAPDLERVRDRIAKRTAPATDRPKPDVRSIDPPPRFSVLNSLRGRTRTGEGSMIPVRPRSAFNTEKTEADTEDRGEDPSHGPPRAVPRGAFARIGRRVRANGRSRLKPGRSPALLPLSFPRVPRGWNRSQGWKPDSPIGGCLPSAA